MAQRVVLVDDIDGETTREVRTVIFGWDGDTYEIDLNERHLTEFARLMAVYRERARLVERASSKRSAGGKLPQDEKQRNAAIRQWAAQQGIACPRVGRVPARVRTAYEEAHKGVAA